MKKYNFGNINHVDDEFYINRQKAFDKLAEVISSGGSAQVKGAPRVGKTAFVRNFWKRFNRYIKGFEFRYITFKGGEIDPLCDIVDQLKAMLSSDIEIAKRNKKKRVVIFDEFGSAVLLTQDNGSLVGLLNYVQVLLDCGIQLVIVAQQSLYGAMSNCNVGKAFLPARETIEEVEITAFSENEFKEYCAHSLAPVDKDMLKAAFDKTCGIAGAINIVLNRLNRFYDSSARRFSNTLITQVSILDEPDVNQNLKYILSPMVERSPDAAADTEWGDTSSHCVNMGTRSMSDREWLESVSRIQRFSISFKKEEQMFEIGDGEIISPSAPHFRLKVRAKSRKVPRINVVARLLRKYYGAASENEKWCSPREGEGWNDIFQDKGQYELFRLVELDPDPVKTGRKSSSARKIRDAPREVAGFKVRKNID